MKAGCVAVLCAALVAGAVAQTTLAPTITKIVWRGGNTNLDNADNWEGNWPWSTERPRSVKFPDNTNGKTIVMKLPGNQVMDVGGSMIMEGNVQISMEDGAVIQFNTNNIGAPATNIAGKDSTSYNLMCHTNWKGVTTTGEEVDVVRPLCHGKTAPGNDVAEFPQENSYYLTVDPGYTQITFKNMMFQGQTIDSCGDLQTYAGNQLYGNCDATFSFDNDASLCSDLYQITSSGGCFCHSSCASGEQLAKDNQETRAANSELLSGTKAKYESITTKTFILSINYQAMSLPNSQMLDTLLADSTQLQAMCDDLSTHLASHWSTIKENITITECKADERDSRASKRPALSLSGRVTTLSKYYFTAIDNLNQEVQETFSCGNIDNWPDAASDNCRYSRVVRHVVQSWASKFWISQSNDKLQEANTACTACTDLLKSDAAAFLGASSDPVNAWNTLRDSNGQASNIDPLPPKTKDDVIAAASPLWNIYNGLSNSDDKVAVDDYVKALALSIAAQRDADKAASAWIRSSTKTSPKFYIGQALTLVEQSRILDSSNQMNFKKSCNATLHSYQGLSMSHAGQFSLDLVSRLRRLASTMAISIQFTYTFFYPAGSNPDDYDPMMKEHIVELVEIRLNAEAMLYAIQPHSQCFSLESSSYNTACLQQQANAAYTAAISAGQSPAQAKEAARTAYLNIVRCGVYGQDDSSNCIGGTDDRWIDNADAVANSAASQSSGGSGGSSNIGMVAGAAAAGVVLIVIIIIIVVMKRGNRTKAAPEARGDRTVVAFENPMYDDPVNSQPVYEDHAHHEGLYDEPAFNQSNADKSNPVYQSQEDLAKDGFGFDGEPSGYLDVAPDQEE